MAGDDGHDFGWYLRGPGGERGPLTAQQLKELARSGGLRREDEVCQGVEGQWRPAATVRGLLPDTVRAFDVFVSYSSKDKSIVDALVHCVEAERVRCWIAPRDILPGANWGEAIIRGIESCRIFLLVLSKHANASQQILQEVERAVAKGLIVVPVRIQDVPVSPRLELYVGARHWLDAFSKPVAEHAVELAASLHRFLGGEQERGARHVPRAATALPASARPGRQSALMWIGGVVAFAAVVVVAWALLSSEPATTDEVVAPPAAAPAVAPSASIDPLATERAAADAAIELPRTVDNAGAASGERVPEPAPESPRPAPPESQRTEEAAAPVVAPEPAQDAQPGIQAEPVPQPPAPQPSTPLEPQPLAAEFRDLEAATAALDQGAFEQAEAGFVRLERTLEVRQRVDGEAAQKLQVIVRCRLGETLMGRGFALARGSKSDEEAAKLMQRAARKLGEVEGVIDAATPREGSSVQAAALRWVVRIEARLSSAYQQMSRERPTARSYRDLARRHRLAAETSLAKLSAQHADATLPNGRTFVAVSSDEMRESFR